MTLRDACVTLRDALRDANVTVRDVTQALLTRLDASHNRAHEDLGSDLYFSQKELKNKSSRLSVTETSELSGESARASNGVTPRDERDVTPRDERDVTHTVTFASRDEMLMAALKARQVEASLTTLDPPRSTAEHDERRGLQLRELDNFVLAERNKNGREP